MGKKVAHRVLVEVVQVNDNQPHRGNRRRRPQKREIAGISGVFLFLLLIILFFMMSKSNIEVFFKQPIYRFRKNKRVTEWFYSKLRTLKWPFSRNFSKARKDRPTPKDAQFCRVHFSHRIFLVWVLVLYLFAVFKKRQKTFLFYMCYESFFCCFVENCGWVENEPRFKTTQ